ncbi:MAG TPA: M2 family metallopeptidase [Gemmatimonadota bacterium]|nr:M2 family metallopeptidase [Gemmatimonadota bacterium]
MERLLQETTERVQPLETAVNRAWWDAAATGSREAYARLEELRNRIDDVFRDPRLFGRLEAAGAGQGRGGAPVERALRLLYLEALPRQVDRALGERMNRLATEIEREFATYRPTFRGEERTANDLDRVLEESRGEGELREAWEASKAVGPRVAERLLELVALRNEAARAVGFHDFHTLKLELYEQEPAGIGGFFDRLDAMTAEPFAALKDEIDHRLAIGLGTSPEALAPWHYRNAYFQEAPDVFGADLDGVYGDADLLAAAAAYYARVGLPVEGVLERSSLHEAPGKDPHAFCIDIDREGDVRILLNLRGNERWMGTTLHELGHAVYDLGVARELPWALRHPSHTLTTEAIAMLFGRLSRNADWMRAAGLVDPAAAEALREPVERELRAQMLVFSRWAQVMARFERELYRRPDQDLNALWWDLKARYQGLAAPPRPAGAADWAAKIHVVVAPVYYHNYMLGECLASQIQAAMRADLDAADPLVPGGPEAGAWLAERIFAPGASLHYDELARRSTGAAVGPEAFAEQFLAPATA